MGTSTGEVVDGLPPGPRLPAWFQALGWALRPTALLRRAEAEFGEIFTLRGLAGGHDMPYVFVSNPAVIKAIATGDRDALRAGAARGFDLFEPVFGPNSILLLDGAAHLRQRKLMLPPFHGERMKRYGELIAAETERRMASWPRGEPFALQEEFQHITLDVILRAVFGFDAGPALAEARERLQAWLVMLASPAAMVPFFRNNLGPARSWTPMARQRDRIYESLYALIRERRADPRVAERDDVLSMLIGARDENGEAMTDEELRDELVTLLLAGHETTATAMAWAIELLLAHPDKLAALRADLPHGDDYLNAVIHETMRLRPPIPLFDRRVCEPIEVLGYRIPVGAVMACNIVSAHRRADVYPDPLAFRPERFLDTPPETYSWIPFGGGVRRCLGAAFALYEMRIVLRMVIERTEPRAIDPQPSRYFRRAIVLAPRSHARVALPA
ncbi:MAG: cytochrome P450 [Actinomycetota bacterium]|nr:cytochrome P450 [Actinomycetota bacterium]